MDLQSNTAGWLDGAINFQVVHGLDSIDPQLDSRTFADDSIIVPVLELQYFSQLILKKFRSPSHR